MFPINGGNFGQVPVSFGQPGGISPSLLDFNPAVVDPFAAQLGMQVGANPLGTFLNDVNSLVQSFLTGQGVPDQPQPPLINGTRINPNPPIQVGLPPIDQGGHDKHKHHGHHHGHHGHHGHHHPKPQEPPIAVGLPPLINGTMINPNPPIAVGLPPIVNGTMINPNPPIAVGLPPLINGTLINPNPPLPLGLPPLT